MNRGEILEKLTDIVKDVLDLNVLTLTETSTAEDVEEWDSIMHVEIIVAIENHYNAKFTTIEIEQIQTVGDIISKIEQAA